MRPVVIVVHQFGSGGATKAVFDQARLFSEMGVPTTIVTFEHAPELSARVAELREAGVLPQDVEVRNPHQDAVRAASLGAAVREGGVRLRNGLRRAAAGAARPLGAVLGGASGLVEATGLVETGRDGHGSYRRIFRGDGEVLAFERLTEDGQVKHINHYENRVLLRRDEPYDGVVRSRQWFDRSGETNREQYLTPDGFCYAQRWVDPKDGRGVGTFIADRRRRTVRRFDGLPSWHVHWLQSVVDEHSTAPFVIGESPSVLPKILRLAPRSALRMAMMHNSHLAAPFALDSPLRPDYSTVFEKLEDFDAFIVLSERQRRDMAERIGHEDAMVVVPNVMDVPDLRAVERDPRLVSIVSRLAEQKALHEAVEAFAHVLEQVPDARLEIYGQGKQRAALERLIAERSLGDRVHLRGRTADPLEVMARSVCTVSTSEWEALPLSIAESLAVGTPVVAYDCLYGPSTLIRDGASGRIVPRYDRAGLADAIVDLLRNPERVEDMGRAGRADVLDALTPASVGAAWRAAFSSAEARHLDAGRRSDRSAPSSTPDQT